MFNLRFEFFFLGPLFFLIACSNMKSGSYVRMHPNESIEKISRRYSISQETLKDANPDSNFRPGDWIFIPQKRGIFGQSLSSFSSISGGGKGNFLWPVPKNYRVSSPFGRRRGRKVHQGIDIPAEKGSHIVASEFGRVIYANNKMRGFGNLVIVKHRKGFYTLYAHASRLLVHKGEMVARGQVLAMVGTTGHSSAPHLHYEVRTKRSAMDPMNFLRTN